MNKLGITIGIVFLLCGGLTVSMAPDLLSLILVILMCAIVFAGYLFGMMPCLNACDGFKRGKLAVHRMAETTTEDRWALMRENDNLFGNKMLNGLFATYMEHADAQYNARQIINNIGTTFNEESLNLRCWQSLCAQIPGTMTGLGLLGTFLGLILGISNIGFSSVSVTLDSVETLLAGIELAFYTSIVGVILSIVYNLLHRMVWNITYREMGLFIQEFHNIVMPTAEEQEREQKEKKFEMIMDRLNRIPKDDGFRIEGDQNVIRRNNEQVVMQNIPDAINNGEFVFYLQPRCRLGSKKIVAAEALIRWDRPGIGLIPPGGFMPVIEKNGFIARLDQYIWDAVVSMLNDRLEAGERPLPVSVNISGTDILAFDVPAYLSELSKKYNVPPVYIEVEIGEAIYFTSGPLVKEVERGLRAAGFRVIMDGFDGDFLPLQELDVMPDVMKLNLSLLKGNINDVFAYAKDNGITLIAEHIESIEQMAALRRCGCDEGQGFVLYEPMDVDTFLRKSEKNVKKTRKEREDE